MRWKTASAFTVGLLAIVGVALAGCGGGRGDSTASSGSAGADLGDASIAFANITNAAPQFVTFRESFESDADRIGVDLNVYDNEFDPQKTVSNAQFAAQAGADLLFEYSPTSSVAQSIETSLGRAGTECIAVNVPLGEDCAWFDLSNQSLGGDTGKYMGMVAHQRGWTGENTSVILVEAAAAGEPVNTGLGFFYEALQEEVPGLAKIKSHKDINSETTSIGDTTVQVDGEGLREASFKAVSGALQNIPADRNLILYTVSDDSAAGAWRAVEQAGRQRTSLIAGLTGSAEGLEQLRSNPSWIAQGSLFYSQWGQYLMAMAQASLDGEELPEMTTAPSAVLTKDTTVPNTSITPIGTYYKEGQTEPFKLPPLEAVHTAETSGLGRGTVGNAYLAKTGVLDRFPLKATAR